MRSVDTNVLLYGLNTGCPAHPVARAVVDDLAAADDVVILDLVLAELYLLLRNPAVVEKPLEAKAAHDICVAYRRHPSWRVAENAPVMQQVWALAAQPEFPRRRVFDARLALTARHHGVTEWITRNADDFTGLGFEKVTNPFD
jgi:toxin-antitoxin system PIN domain toxin